LIFVGRLSREKGVDVLLNGFAKALLINTNLKLLIIGKGPEKNNLMKLANKLKIQNNINFLGKVPHEQLAKYYINSSAIVIPSIWIENCPMVALEAIGYSKPIIASNAGGLKDLVDDGSTGLLFNINDPTDLASKLNYFFSDTKLQNKLKNNQRKLSNNFTAENHYKKIIEVYSKVIFK
jgi:glycosyltransferase involved in cell wall biosynthesis